MKTLSEMTNAELVEEYVRRGGEAPKSGKFRDKATGIAACEEIQKQIDARAAAENEAIVVDESSGGIVIPEKFSESIREFLKQEKAVFGEPVSIGYDTNYTLEDCAKRRGVVNIIEEFAKNKEIFLKKAEEYILHGTSHFSGTPVGIMNYFEKTRSVRTPRKRQPRVTRQLKQERRERRRQVAKHLRGF